MYKKYRRTDMGNKYDMLANLLYIKVASLGARIDPLIAELKHKIKHYEKMVTEKDNRIKELAKDLYKYKDRAQRSTKRIVAHQERDKALTSMNKGLFEANNKLMDASQHLMNKYNQLNKYRWYDYGILGATGLGVGYLLGRPRHKNIVQQVKHMFKQHPIISGLGTGLAGYGAYSLLSKD